MSWCRTYDKRLVPISWRSYAKQQASLCQPSNAADAPPRVLGTSSGFTRCTTVPGAPLICTLGGRRGSVVFSLGFSQCASVKESLQPVNMSYRGSQLAELCMSVSRPFPTIKCSGRATTCSGRIKRVHPLHHGASRAADLHVGRLERVRDAFPWGWLCALP